MEHEIHVNGHDWSKHQEFKYLGCVLDESGTDVVKCCRKVTYGRKVEGAIRSLVNTRGLQLECERVLHEELLVLVLLNGSETIIWREKDRSKIRAMQMDNLRGLLGIRRMDRVLTVLIVQGVKRGGQRINENIL